MWGFFYTKLSTTRGVENIWASKLEWNKKGGGGPEGPNQADWGWESNNLFEIKLSPPNLISVLLIVLLSRTAFLDLERSKRPCPIETSHHTAHQQAGSSVIGSILAENDLKKSRTPFVFVQSETECRRERSEFRVQMLQWLKRSDYPPKYFRMF